MKRQLLSLLLVFALVLGMLPVSARANDAVPDQADGVYQIGTAAELLWFAGQVNSGEKTISAVLTADIDLRNAASWPGIGTAENPFGGSFNGQGKTVIFEESAWGLFGSVLGTSSARAKVENVITEGSVKKSAIAHQAGYAVITGCINRATVNAVGSGVGGIVGSIIGISDAGNLYSNVEITNCGNEASVSGTGSEVGGILGISTANTKLNGCYNTGYIYGSSNVGGLAGYLKEATGECYVTYSYNTGRVDGETAVGGIIGNMYNGVDVSFCYNSGFVTYAIAGNRYNNTARILNSYFLGTASAKSSPDYNQTMLHSENINEITTRATAASAAEMASADFALIGSRFKVSCPTPVLDWQTANAHTGSNTCENCNLGSTKPETYDVTFQSDIGYTLTGLSKATQGASYSFTLTIKEGYEKDNLNFCVKVNGTPISATSGSTYLVTTVTGPVSVTVIGVKSINDQHTIQHPSAGSGFTINGENFALRDQDYTFTVSFKTGFRAGKNFKIIARQIPGKIYSDEAEPKLEEFEVQADAQGVYTIPKVALDYRLIVSGVEVVSYEEPVQVSFSITEGFDNFHYYRKQQELMLDRTLTVPYFDLSLYGLERYYYNPYCYQDEAGNIRNVQQKGTPESAHDKITLMHAFIVATEVFYLGYKMEDAGKGDSHKVLLKDANGNQILKDDGTPKSLFDDAVSWSQGAGSSFMDFWDHGTNLNYYLNYEYPLAYTGWGSTSDQIRIKKGDVISVHMITGDASGSRFGFFVANDQDGQYTYEEDIVDTIQVEQGKKINLTLYWTATTGNYATKYERVKNKEVYWVKQGWEETDVKDWNRTDFGKNTADKLITDSNGVVSINTYGIEAGTYYLATLGGWTEGGAVDNDGFKSAGGETGPAVFKLVIEPYNGRPGDINGDNDITAADAAMAYRCVKGTLTLSETQRISADVDGNGEVLTSDAAMLYRKVKGTLAEFPITK